MYKCPEKCVKCEYTSLIDKPIPDAYCTQCNNEIGFYQIEGEYFNHPLYNNYYMECYTWRKEKLDIDSHYNHYPRLDTLFNESLKVFQKCNEACEICTSIDLSLYSPHCQAKKCKTFVFLMIPDFLFIIYILTIIQVKNILDPVMTRVKLVQRQEQEVLIIALLVEKDLYFILMI